MGHGTLGYMHTMVRVLVIAALVGLSAASLPSSLTREQVEERYGSVNWDSNVKTMFCSNCQEISVESHGGAAEWQQYRLGRFTLAGSLFKASNGQYMTADPFSNPIIYQIKWVISETVGGFNAGIQNNQYVDGIRCPWEIPDQWEYEHDRQWFVDPTLKVTCVRYRDEE